MRIPTAKDEREAWIQILNLQPGSKGSPLCPSHFREEDIERISDRYTIVRYGARPVPNKVVYIHSYGANLFRTRKNYSTGPSIFVSIIIYCALYLKDIATVEATKKSLKRSKLGAPWP